MSQVNDILQKFNQKFSEQIKFFQKSDSKQDLKKILHEIFRISSEAIRDIYCIENEKEEQVRAVTHLENLLRLTVKEGKDKQFFLENLNRYLTVLKLPLSEKTKVLQLDVAFLREEFKKMDKTSSVGSQDIFLQQNKDSFYFNTIEDLRLNELEDKQLIFNVFKHMHPHHLGGIGCRVFDNLLAKANLKDHLADQKRYEVKAVVSFSIYKDQNVVRPVIAVEVYYQDIQSKEIVLFCNYGISLQRDNQNNYSCNPMIEYSGLNMPNEILRKTYEKNAESISSLQNKFIEEFMHETSILAKENDIKEACKIFKKLDGIIEKFLLKLEAIKNFTSTDELKIIRMSAHLQNIQRAISKTEKTFDENKYWHKDIVKNLYDLCSILNSAFNIDENAIGINSNEVEKIIKEIIKNYKPGLGKQSGQTGDFDGYEEKTLLGVVNNADLCCEVGSFISYYLADNKNINNHYNRTKGDAKRDFNVYDLNKISEELKLDKLEKEPREIFLRFANQFGFLNIANAFFERTFMNENIGLNGKFKNLKMRSVGVVQNKPVVAIDILYQDQKGNLRAVVRQILCLEKTGRYSYLKNMPSFQGSAALENADYEVVIKHASCKFHDEYLRKYYIVSVQAKAWKNFLEKKHLTEYEKSILNQSLEKDCSYYPPIDTSKINIDAIAKLFVKASEFFASQKIYSFEEDDEGVIGAYIETPIKKLMELRDKCLTEFGSNKKIKNAINVFEDVICNKGLKNEISFFKALDLLHLKCTPIGQLLKIINEKIEGISKKMTIANKDEINRIFQGAIDFFPPPYLDSLRKFSKVYEANPIYGQLDSIKKFDEKVFSLDLSRKASLKAGEKNNFDFILNDSPDAESFEKNLKKFLSEVSKNYSGKEKVFDGVEILFEKALKFLAPIKKLDANEIALKSIIGSLLRLKYEKNLYGYEVNKFEKLICEKVAAGCIPLKDALELSDIAKNIVLRNKIIKSANCNLQMRVDIYNFCRSNVGISNSFKPQYLSVLQDALVGTHTNNFHEDLLDVVLSNHEMAKHLIENNASPLPLLKNSPKLFKKYFAPNFVERIMDKIGFMHYEFKVDVFEDMFKNAHPSMQKAFAEIVSNSTELKEKIGENSDFYKQNIANQQPALPVVHPPVLKKENNNVQNNGLGKENDKDKGKDKEDIADVKNWFQL